MISPAASRSRIEPNSYRRIRLPGACGPRVYPEQRRALRVLEHFFPDDHVGLRIEDKPDLVNERLGIGVEVTWVTSPEEKESQALHAKLPYVGDEAKRARYLERIEQDGALGCQRVKDRGIQQRRTVYVGKTAP